MSESANFSKYRIHSIYIAVAAILLSAGIALAGDATIEDIEKGLKLSEKELVALGAVVDGVSQYKETALYMLLQRTANLPRLSDEDFACLDRPAYRSLLNDPQRYRARPMRLAVRVYRVREIAGEDFAPPYAWPSERSVWRIDCTSAEMKDYQAGPMSVFTAFDPTGLTKPTKITPEGEKLYELGNRAPVVELAAVFYKVYKGTEQLSGAERDYPILLAWQIAPVRRGRVCDALDPAAVVTLSAIVTLALAYYLVRRYVKRTAEKYNQGKALNRWNKP